MLEYEGFRKLAEEIMSQGYDERTAATFAGLIGDTPEFGEDGNCLASDENGILLAALKPLTIFDGDRSEPENQGKRDD